MAKITEALRGLNWLAALAGLSLLAFAAGVVVLIFCGNPLPALLALLAVSVFGGLWVACT